MTKLGMKLNDEALAAKLMAAGYETPRKIRDALDAELKKHLTASEVSRVREAFPRDK